jgi:hypothetical protein
MPLVIESRRKKPDTLHRHWPEATVLDVTSKGIDPWVKFSPFYPHGGIPVPNSADRTAQSVEGIWQGLKVFESEDIDPDKFEITTMRGIKRSGWSRGRVLGHRFGEGSPVLLPYREARLKIYLPSYRWVLEHCLEREVQELQVRMAQTMVVLLDYETNEDLDNLGSPLSHAGLVKRYLEGRWPGDAGEPAP